ncbi:hypothetical protein COB87_000895 [Candidatus Wolfebacteria bacterium]|nr:hypothetical protein [Candidatus Wolfebacteria bacterium]
MDYTQVLAAVSSAGEINFLYLVGLLALITWTLAWKGLGLWNSAKNGQKIWFVVILLFNTIGLLPILYHFFFRKRTQKGQELVEKHFPTKEAEEEPKRSL